MVGRGRFLRSGAGGKRGCPMSEREPLMRTVMLPSIRDNVQINLFMAGLLISVVLSLVLWFFRR